MSIVRSRPIYIYSLHFRQATSEVLVSEERCATRCFLLGRYTIVEGVLKWPIHPLKTSFFLCNVFVSFSLLTLPVRVNRGENDHSAWMSIISAFVPARSNPCLWRAKQVLFVVEEEDEEEKKERKKGRMKGRERRQVSCTTASTRRREGGEKEHRCTRRDMYVKFKYYLNRHCDQRSLSSTRSWQTYGVFTFSLLCLLEAKGEKESSWPQCCSYMGHNYSDKQPRKENMPSTKIVLVLLAKNVLENPSMYLDASRWPLSSIQLVIVGGVWREKKRTLCAMNKLMCFFRRCLISQKEKNIADFTTKTQSILPGRVLSSRRG